MKGDVKKCRNPMCGNLIYYYQDSFSGGYCDGDCRQEVIHNRKEDKEYLRKRRDSIKRHKEPIEINMKSYPHKTLPVVLWL